MRRIGLSIVSFLTVLVLSAPLAYSADTPISTTVSSDPAAVFAVEPIPKQVNLEATFVNSISDLLDSDVGYSLDESLAISLVYSPFVSARSDAQTNQSASDIYVGFNFSF